MTRKHIVILLCAALAGALLGLVGQTADPNCLMALLFAPGQGLLSGVSGPELFGMANSRHRRPGPSVHPAAPSGSRPVHRLCAGPGSFSHRRTEREPVQWGCGGAMSVHRPLVPLDGGVVHPAHRSAKSASVALPALFAPVQLSGIHPPVLPGAGPCPLPAVPLPPAGEKL